MLLALDAKSGKEVWKAKRPPERACYSTPFLYDPTSGVITLDGTVETREQLLKAAEAIRKVPGVKSVDTKPVTVTSEK